MPTRQHLARRNGEELVTFFQIMDGQGIRYLGNSSIQLNRLDPNIKAAAVQSVQQAFFPAGRISALEQYY